MAIISFTIADNNLPEVIDAYCMLYMYQDMINGAPNPETRAQFTKRMIALEIKGRVIAYRRTVAERSINAVEPDVS